MGLDKEHPSYWAYEADGDALARFQSRTPDARTDALFMAQLAMMRSLDGIDAHLLQLNGSVAETKKELAVHLEMEKLERREIDFVKRWGGRGTGFLAVMIASAASIVVMIDRLW